MEDLGCRYSDIIITMSLEKPLPTPSVYENSTVHHSLLYKLETPPKRCVEAMQEDGG